MAIADIDTADDAIDVRLAASRAAQIAMNKPADAVLNALNQHEGSLHAPTPSQYR